MWSEKTLRELRCDHSGGLFEIREGAAERHQAGGVESRCSRTGVPEALGECRRELGWLLAGVLGRELLALEQLVVEIRGWELMCGHGECLSEVERPGARDREVEDVQAGAVIR